MPLPDYRNIEDLNSDHLADAINRAIGLYQLAPACETGGLYLHCWAGRQRSPLMATALLHRSEGLPLLDALAEVRRLHAASQPIAAHLALLDGLLG